MAEKVIILGESELREAVSMWINQRQPREAFGPPWTVNVVKGNGGFSVSVSKPEEMARWPHTR